MHIKDAHHARQKLCLTVWTASSEGNPLWEALLPVLQNRARDWDESRTTPSHLKVECCDQLLHQCFPQL